MRKKRKKKAQILRDTETWILERNDIVPACRYMNVVHTNNSYE